MRAPVLTILFLLAAAAPAMAQTREQASLERGRTLVEHNCGVCHATGRAGDSPYKPAPHFRDLHLRYDIEDLAEALGEGLITGHPAMPEFRFEPGEVNDIIRYLKSIQTHQHARTEPQPFVTP